MANKTNKNLIIGIVVAVIAVIAIVVGVVIATRPKGGDGDDGADANDNTAQTESSTQNVDYSNIDVIVGFGDYEVMEAQAKAIQNGEMMGKIIQIDGLVSHPMSKYSIVEEDENGSKIGTEFVIEGLDEDSYPQDGDRVIITGEVIEKQPLYYIIKTSPEYVEVVESASEVEE